MLLVKTKLAVSNISGIGLFADEFIPKGTYIWKFKKGFDMRFDKDYPNMLPEPAKSFFLTYASQNPETLNYSLDADNARFFNHSSIPNTHGVNDSEDENAACIASRNIQPGEELTCDYCKFDTNPFIGFDNSGQHLK
jgi:hypothetical protein